MIEEKLSRQQRKQLIKEEVKQKVNTGYQPSLPSSYVKMEEFNRLVGDMQRLLNYAKTVDNHVWMIIETLSRKNIMNWSDVNDTEKLYLKKEETKEKKVKELLEKLLTVKEYLEEIKEDITLPNYEQLNINPVKDLNLNPFEVGSCLREEKPEAEEQTLVNQYKHWGLTGEHFGFPAKTAKQS